MGIYSNDLVCKIGHHFGCATFSASHCYYILATFRIGHSLCLDILYTAEYMVVLRVSHWIIKMGEPMTTSSRDNHAIATLERIKTIDATPKSSYAGIEVKRELPAPSLPRKIDSLDERPFDLEGPADEALHELNGQATAPPTVFYLAYGSNLCYETFQGKRGIRPLAQLNVLVPELVLTFDMSGLPYLEPCFANTKYRRQKSEESETATITGNNGTLLHSNSSKYHKTRWQKGLVGVVYEVTTSDYAKIIATEGGGSSYTDILVTCYELPPYCSSVPDSSDTILTLPSLKAHTLYCPTFPRGHPALSHNGRVSRPDPNYAQASARYLNLIITGADEHALPQEYIDYLRNIRPYTLTSRRQKLGRLVFMGILLPAIVPAFYLNSLLADKRGETPWWLRMALRGVLGLSWRSHDWVFRYVFGDGERTMGC